MEQFRPQNPDKPFVNPMEQFRREGPMDLSWVKYPIQIAFGLFMMAFGFLIMCVSFPPLGIWVLLKIYG